MQLLRSSQLLKALIKNKNVGIKADEFWVMWFLINTHQYVFNLRSCQLHEKKKIRTKLTHKDEEFCTANGTVCTSEATLIHNCKVIWDPEVEGIM